MDFDSEILLLFSGVWPSFYSPLFARSALLDFVFILTRCFTFYAEICLFHLAMSSWKLIYEMNCTDPPVTCSLTEQEKEKFGSRANHLKKQNSLYFAHIS